MFKNYLKITFRNILRHKTYSFLNIFGLAVGIASFIIILIYVNYELSYDKWDPSLTKVYKLSLRQNQDILSTTQAPLASLLKQNYPNVEAATAIMPDEDFEVLLSSGEKTIYQKGIVTVDSSFLKVFPYKLIRGNASVALNTPNAVILSNEVSHKLFGDADPMGKSIKIYNAVDGVVTGIMQKPDGPSHLDAEMLMRDPFGKQNNFWQNYSFQTYIKIKHPVTEAELENSVNRIYYDSQLKKDGRSYEEYKKSSNQTALFSDAVQDLHNFPKHGENHFAITIILLILAAFLLIAGAINFSNLSLAKAVTKAKEVGIRKVLGSKRIHIIIQSLLDIAFQCCLSLLFAILFVNIALPYFSKSFNLPLSFFNNQRAISISLQIVVSLFFIILISGLYPALFLSHFKTEQVLKGNYTKGTKGIFFRNSLLVVQLTLSAIFIIGMIVINRQMDFMQTKDLGFNSSQVLRITATQKNREENFSVVRNELLSVPGVEYVAKSTEVPGSKVVDTSSLEFRYAGKKVRLNSDRVSIDYFKAMNIQLLRGRLFENGRAEDLNNTAIINETAAKKMSIENPVGQTIYFPFCDTIPYTIVGVVKDFNVQGLQYQINPAIYTTSNAHCGYKSGGAILVKIKTEHARQTLAGIETVWKKTEPAFPIRYSFLDQDFQNLLAEYIQIGKLISFFTIISIVIAAIGLFALTSFLAQQRVKEIGIRKVLGASVSAITVLLSKDFIRLVIIAIFISTPIAWWALHKWLENFAYRISLSLWMSVLASVITISITLIVVCFGAIKAAMANPVKNLRAE
jgi:putative ABC transport system permease protein